jgi:hypothetical protein
MDKCSRQGCTCPKFQKFGWTTQVVNNETSLPIPQFTNSILVVNTGNSLAQIEGFPINPRLVAGMNGEPWSIGGNVGEIVDMPGLNIMFPAAGTGQVIVQFKFFKISC